MGKSLSAQVRGVWAASGILQAGGSRYARKQQARDELTARGVGATSARIAALTPICSFRTYDAYKAVSAAFARFAQAQGVTRVQDLRPEHAEAFMQAKLNDGLSCNTMRTYAAALSKLDCALSTAPKSMRIPQEARLLPGVESVRAQFNREAPRLDQSRRAYFTPMAVVQAVQCDTHRLIARLQLSAGFRVSEVLALGRGSLRGEKVDPVTGNIAGVIHVVGKGGYQRNQFVAVADYRALAKHLEAHNGNLETSYKSYLAALHQAANATGEVWGGSHGLRHNYVRLFIVEAAEAGLSSKELMREAMERLGHHRISELKTYCR